MDSDKVVEGIDSLKSAGVNVKFVILDDGWQSTGLSTSSSSTSSTKKVTTSTSVITNDKMLDTNKVIKV